MHTPHRFIGREAAGITYLLIASGAFCLSQALVSTASAALIVDTLRYDGHVSNGIDIGVEKHSTTTNIPPNPGVLPADNSMLPGALADGRDLNATTTEFLGAFDGMILQHFVLTIEATNPALDTFVNPLDPNIALPVELEANFFSNALGAGEKVGVKAIGIENFNPLPFPPPGSSMISGLGTPLNPLNVKLGIAANQVATKNGFVKVHIYYMNMAVPEPSTAALILVGALGVFRLVCRQRR